MEDKEGFVVPLEYRGRRLGSSGKDESGVAKRDLSWGERFRGLFKPVDNSPSRRRAEGTQVRVSAIAG